MSSPSLFIIFASQIKNVIIVVVYTAVSERYATPRHQIILSNVLGSRYMIHEETDTHGSKKILFFDIWTARL
jgi:hypothetical protein